MLWFNQAVTAWRSVAETNSEEDELMNSTVNVDCVIRLSCYTTLSCVLLCLFSFFFFSEKPRASVLVRGLIFLFFSRWCMMLHWGKVRCWSEPHYLNSLFIRDSVTGFHVYLYIILYVCSFYCSGEDRSYFYMYIVAKFCKYFILFVIVLCKTRVLCKYSSLETVLFGVYLLFYACLERFVH